jgi:para-nitrobenzyl esterase
VASRDAQQQPQLNPDIDGWVLTRSPAASYTSGQELAIPLLIGSNTLESGGGPETPEQVRKEINDFMGDLAPQALALYGLTDGSPPVADPLYGVPGVQWPSDLRFHCNATSVALWHREANHPVYEYQFDHTIPGLGEKIKGAWHTFELPYVMGIFPKSGPLAGKFIEMDYKLSDLMETYWTNFAKTGNPNSDTLSHWPELGESQIFLEFKEDGRAVASTTAQRGPQCNLYRKALERNLNRKQ